MASSPKRYVKAFEGAPKAFSRKIPFSALFDGVNDSLSFTPSAEGNRKTWTYSAWMKPCDSSYVVAGRLFSADNGSGTDASTSITFTASGQLQVFHFDGAAVLFNLISFEKFVDPTAHYHIVVAVDTTQVTDSERVKLFVNGVRLTAFATSVLPSLNFQTFVNSANQHTLMAEGGQPWNAQGYLSEIYLIDGQALPPCTWGEFSDQATGLWAPKAEVVIPTVLTTPKWESGNRTGSIVVTGSPGCWRPGYEYVNALVDGVVGDGDGGQRLLFNNANTAVAGKSLTFDFGASRIVTGARYYHGRNGDHDNWKWQGSHDAAAWDDLTDAFLWSGTNSSATAVGDLSGNAVAYRYYRLLGVSGDIDTDYLWEMEFAFSEAVSYGANGCRLDFSNAGNLGEDSAQDKTFEDYGGNMLVGGAPSGTPRHHPNWPIEHAFDGSTGTAHAVNLSTYPLTGGVYTQYEVSTAFIPGKYSLSTSGMSGSAYTSGLSAWEIHASNDGWATYDVLDTQFAIATGNQLTHTYTLDSDVAYRHYRVKHVASGHAGYSDVADFKVWAKPVMRSPNDWSVTGAPAQTKDTPTDNHCTFNPLVPDYNAANRIVLEEGNLKLVGDASYDNWGVSALQMKTGSRYWEVEAQSVDGVCAVGITRESRIFSSLTEVGVFWQNDGKLFLDGVLDSAIASFATGDVLGIAFNVDSLSVELFKNNVPAAVKVLSPAQRWFSLVRAGKSSSATMRANFGAAGFTYAPPTGFKPLSTANLPEPVVKKSAAAAQLVLRDGDSFPNVDVCVGGSAYDSSRSGSRTGAKCFDGNYYDGNNNHVWQTGSAFPGGVGYAHVGYDFPAPKTVRRYAVYSAHFDVVAYPRDWTLQGSNDGADWTILDTVTGQSWSKNQRREFVVDNPGEYARYRLAATRTNGHSLMVIGEIEMYDNAKETQVAVDPAMAGGPDWVNIKSRSGSYDWQLYDSVRGATKYLNTNESAREETIAEGLSAFLCDGYRLGEHGFVNGQGHTFVDLALKAGVDQGFEIVTYAGDGVAGRQIPHSLGTAPTFMLIKDLTTAYSWIVYHAGLGATKALFLEAMNAADTSAAHWNNTEPTATHFTLGSNLAVNKAGDNYVAYLFTDSDIFKAFSYTGNGIADGPFVNLGGRPLSIPFIKDTSDAFAWGNFDAAREPFNPVGDYLVPNAAAAETTGFDVFNFTSTGFKYIYPGGAWGTNNHLIVGLAILESTNKYANAY